MSVWPAQKTVAAAFAGTVREVLTLRDGSKVGGLSSAYPWVRCIVGNGAACVCDRCADGEAMPPSPTSQGLNGAGEPLFSPGTKAHALFALTWLNAFASKHAECPE